MIDNVNQNEYYGIKEGDDYGNDTNTNQNR